MSCKDVISYVSHKSMITFEKQRIINKTVIDYGQGKKRKKHDYLRQRL